VIEATRPRLAILSYSNGRFDARTRRVARSAEEAGFDVVAYARWEPGVPLEETIDGLRIVRAPIVARMAIPGLRRSGRREVARLRAAAAAPAAEPGPAKAAPVAGADARRRPPTLPTGGRTRPLSVRLRELRDDPVGYSRHVATRVVRLPARAVRRLVGPFVLFPLRPRAWAAALEDVAEPADLWHGMWAGSLPALERLRRRHGGRTVYDSRDVYLHARVFDRMRPALRRRFVRLEQRWARRRTSSSPSTTRTRTSSPRSSASAGRSSSATARIPTTRPERVPTGSVRWWGSRPKRRSSSTRAA
jgi:hypothetical protein